MVPFQGTFSLPREAVCSMGLPEELVSTYCPFNGPRLRCYPSLVHLDYSLV